MLFLSRWIFFQGNISDSVYMVNDDQHPYLVYIWGIWVDQSSAYWFCLMMLTSAEKTSLRTERLFPLFLFLEGLKHTHIGAHRGVCVCLSRRQNPPGRSFFTMLQQWKPIRQNKKRKTNSSDIRRFGWGCVCLRVPPWLETCTLESKSEKL